MKKLYWICIVALVCTNSIFVSAQNGTRDLLKQWLVEEINKQNYAKALSYFNQLDFVFLQDDYDFSLDMEKYDSFCVYAFEQNISDNQKIQLYKYSADYAYFYADYLYSEKEYNDAQFFFEAAIQFYDPIHEFYPIENVFSYNMLGNILSVQQNHKEAANAYKNALLTMDLHHLGDTLGMYQTIINNMMLLTDTLSILHSLEEVYSQFHNVVAKTAAHSDLLYVLAKLHYTLQEYDKSYDYCQALCQATKSDSASNQIALNGLLLNAIHQGNYSNTLSSIQNGADVNTLLWDSSPLLLAINKDNNKFMDDTTDVTKNIFAELMLKSGAKVDAILPNLQTAVLYEDYRLCHLLLQYGSNPNSLVYNDSVTVIQYAERNGLKRFVKLLKNKRAYSEELTIQELDMLYKRAQANQDFQLTQKYAEQALSQFAEEIDEAIYTGFRNREQILFYYVSALVNQALIAETNGEFILAENLVRQAIQYEEERSKYPNKPSLGFGDLDEILLGAILERTGDRGENLLAINDFERRKSGPQDKYYWLSLAKMAQYYNNKYMIQHAHYAYSKLLGYCSTIENPLDTLGEWNYIRMLNDFSYIQYTLEDSIALRKEGECADALFKSACGTDSTCYYMALSHLGDNLLGQEQYNHVLQNLVRIIKNTQDPQDPAYYKLISQLEFDIFMNNYRYDEIAHSNDSSRYRQFIIAAQPLIDNLHQYQSYDQDILIQQWVFCNFYLEQWQNIIDIAPYYFNNVREHIQNQLATMSSEMATAWLHNTNPFNLDHQISVAVSRTTTPSNQASAAMYNHELFKKGLLLRNNDHLRQYIMDANDTSAIYLYDKIQSLKVQREKLNENHQNDSLVLSISKEIDNKERLLYSLSHTYQEQVQADNLSWKDIQNSLKPNEVAIEFVNFGYIDQYYALLLRKEFDAPKIVHLPNFKRHPQEDKDFWLDIYQKDLEMYEKYHWSDSLRPKKPHFLEFSGSESRIYEIYGYGANGTDLYQALWKPLEGSISKGETIYFAPSGVLHQLSVEALPYDATQTIGDMYNLIRVSSTRELVISKKSKKYDTATLFGGIQYDVSAEDICAASEKYIFDDPSVFRSVDIDTTNRGTVRYLKGTKLEVENISNLLKQQKVKVNVYTATTANEESIKAISGKKQNILHIATHGFFWTDSIANKQEYFTPHFVSTTDRAPLSIEPLNRCGLLFAGANLALSGNRGELPETVQDGILTAKEVSLLDLRETDIVVLSACETGRGEVTGEGVFGLQRAFKMAGVQTIIMSLWPVNDEATQLLMTEFYNNWIGKHQSKREAFRNAQKTVRYSQYDDPVYWAGFIMLD